MIKQLRASVTVALSLLTSAATAHAECAWVLWHTIREKYPLRDLPLPRGELHHQAGLGGIARQSQEDLRAMPDPKYDHIFVCLRDTVDPRGPKGN